MEEITLNEKTSNGKEQKSQENSSPINNCLPPLDTKKSLWKNLLLISFGLTGVMTSYDMLRYVESSLNSEKSLGTASLATIYALNILCALFFPTFFIQRFGCKKTFIISISAAFVYYLSHFYPTFYTLIPGGLFMGFAFGLARTSANTLVTELGNAYSKLTGRPTVNSINSFFGVFIFLTFTARIWGNLTESLVLSREDTAINSRLSICGKNYCWQDLKSTTLSNDQSSSVTLPIGNDNPNSPVSYQAYTLYGIAAATGVLTLIIIIIFMDDRRDEFHQITGKEEILKRATATLMLVKEPKMLLMIPITFTLGLIESYMSGDYPKAFVTCSLGIHHVGFVIICYGTTAALSSYLWSWLANKINRPTVIIIGTLINIAAIIVMLLWQPNPNTPVIYYLISGAWGLADAVWRSQLYAMYGHIFYTKREAGFANFEVWESIGLVIGYTYNELICITTKLYIISGMLGVGVFCYIIVEIIMWRAKKDEITNATAFQS